MTIGIQTFATIIIQCTTLVAIETIQSAFQWIGQAIANAVELGRTGEIAAGIAGEIACLGERK